ncbi:hypothetical protein H1C71_012016 [Ictidomys tridecemlineatus]|nr:hypothetical protein H1C71_012016 [Ictidomys tridecemlineatus]KAG3290718.1 hypothetical protein H1C71_012016 [Ictidomys tridecemlineatus]
MSQTLPSPHHLSSLETGDTGVSSLGQRPLSLVSRVSHVGLLDPEVLSRDIHHHFRFTRVPPFGSSTLEAPWPAAAAASTVPSVASDLLLPSHPGALPLCPRIILLAELPGFLQQDHWISETGRLLWGPGSPLPQAASHAALCLCLQEGSSSTFRQSPLPARNVLGPERPAHLESELMVTECTSLCC